MNTGSEATSPASTGDTPRNAQMNVRTCVRGSNEERMLSQSCNAVTLVPSLVLTQCSQLIAETRSRWPDAQFASDSNRLTSQIRRSAGAVATVFFVTSPD